MDSTNIVFRLRIVEWLVIIPAPAPPEASPAPTPAPAPPPQSSSVALALLAAADGTAPSPTTSMSSSHGDAGPPLTTFDEQRRLSLFRVGRRIRRRAYEVAARGRSAATRGHGHGPQFCKAYSAAAACGEVCGKLHQHQDVEAKASAKAKAKATAIPVKAPPPTPPLRDPPIVKAPPPVYTSPLSGPLSAILFKYGFPDGSFYC